MQWCELRLTLRSETQSSRGSIAETQRGSLLALTRAGTVAAGAVCRKPTPRLYFLHFNSHLESHVHNPLQGSCESSHQKTWSKAVTQQVATAGLWLQGVYLKKNTTTHKQGITQQAKLAAVKVKWCSFLLQNLSKAFQGLQPVAIGGVGSKQA